MRRLWAWLTKAGLGISLIPAFVARFGWDMTDKFMSLVSEGYRRNAVAYACIRTLATAIAEAPCRIYNAKTDAEQPAHDVRILLERPNPFMSEYEFWELVVTHLAVGGRSPWFKEMSNGGGILNLWPLRPDRVTPLLGDLSKGEPLLRAWAYKLDTKTYELRPDQVLFFNLPDPGDETGGLVGGLGPLQVLSREVDTDNEATAFTFSLLRNAAIPGTVISTKAKLQKDDAQRLKENFRARYGEMHRGEPAVIDAESTVTVLSHSMRDLEFPDLRSVSESRIAAAIGVPAILVGLKVGLDRSTFSNMQEARRYFAETTCADWWRRLADQINLDLGDPSLGVVGANLVARFDTDDVTALQAAQTEKAQKILDGLKAGAVLIDDYRVAIGLDPLPGGKGQVFLRSTLITEVRLEDAGVPPEPTPKPPAPNQGNPPVPPEPAPEPTANGKPPKALVGAGAKAGKPNPRAIERRHRERINAATRAHAPKLAAVYRAQGEAVVRRFLARAKAAEEDDLISAEEEGTVSDSVAAIHAQVLAQASQDAADTLGLEGYEMGAGLTEDVLGKLGTSITGINETTRDDVSRIVGAGLDEGLSTDEIADNLRGLYDETYSGRSETIARTESINAYNLGTTATYRDSGLVEEVEVFDGDYDEECAAADGEIWTLDQAEENPTEHPNCQRGFSPVVLEPEYSGLRLVG